MSTVPLLLGVAGAVVLGRMVARARGGGACGGGGRHRRRWGGGGRGFRLLRALRLDRAQRAALWPVWRELQGSIAAVRAESWAGLDALAGVVAEERFDQAAAEAATARHGD